MLYVIATHIIKYTYTYSNNLKMFSSSSQTTYSILLISSNSSFPNLCTILSILNYLLFENH